MTEKVLLKEIKELPEKIMSYFSELTDISDYISYRNGTGTVQELDNDKDIDNDNVIDNVGYKAFQVKRKQLLCRSY